MAFLLLNNIASRVKKTPLVLVQEWRLYFFEQKRDRGKNSGEADN